MSNPFDLGPLAFTKNGKQVANFTRAHYDGERVRIFGEYQLPEVTLVYDGVPDQIDYRGAQNIRWEENGDTYMLTRATGCGCNYRKLTIKRLTEEQLLNYV